MDQKIIDLYNEYTHAPLPRREFLNRLAQLTGGMAAALALAPRLEADTNKTGLVPTNDARLEILRTEYQGATGPIKSYFAKPKGSGKFPAVIVIHENRGLNAHIEDVTRRMALEGFLALGVDILSPAGGTPANEDTARELIGKLDPSQTIQNLLAAVAFLKKHTAGNGKVGAVGFCWGGGMVGELAVNAPDLSGGVVFYGRQPKSEDVPKIKAPLLCHYAGLDKRINDGIPAFESALKTAGKKFTIHMYDNVNHAFNNDTSEARYNKEAADLAWSRTIAFFKENLKS